MGDRQLEQQNKNQTFIQPTAGSSSEDLFVDIFQEALGFERTQLLIPQYSVRDIYQQSRYIDFAFLSRQNNYAFEIDGEVWHTPGSPLIDSQKFRDDLLRQNSLIYQGWKVYRWTDVQLAADRERVLEQLRLFLEKEIAAGTLDGFLPLQTAGEVSLRSHQADALQELATLREQGVTIALVTHATGTGKTHIALSDAQRLGLRTLYLAHTTPLLSQAKKRFAEIWPTASGEIYRPNTGKPDSHIVIASIQAMTAGLSDFDEREFGYIIVDEAHHAAAETYRKIIGYFRCKFLLGLTATPERHDGQSLIDIFRNTAHRLELSEAIERGLLVPIRCVRVRTNVDLSNIRFNGVDYRAADLEQSIIVPDRDRLIVDTYKNHVNGKRAVCFCVNVAHAERIAEEFNRQGITAAAVSGRMGINQREQILSAYQSGEINVLCACDMLNEGWDSPETAVLLMARPTLSKVLYVQQLGRGTRTAPGKDCLIVFDFIDNSSRYAQAMNIHRLFRQSSYRPGALVAAPADMIAEEEKELTSGNKPTAMLQLHVWADHYEPVDIFRWQDEAQNMLQTSELEVELGIGEGTVLNWINTGKITPDHSITLGSRTYHYFVKDRVNEIRKEFGIAPITSENIKELFFQFVCKMDMSSSYKPVLLLGLLELADNTGRVKRSALVDYFRNFYTQRAKEGLIVEAPSYKMAHVMELSDSEIEAVMLAMPFEKFERRRFVQHMRELSVLKFWQPLWKALTAEDKATLRKLALGAIDSYYERLNR
ncbi:MAG: DEAD/DEAH box helicase family protein [Acidobacteriota bacterium]